MASGARLLDNDLLDEFEAVLKARRIGIFEAWAPGLTDDDIDEIIAGSDLLLPEEVRVWWRRHNGRRQEIRRPGTWALVPGREPLSLQDVVRSYKDIGADDQRLPIVHNRPQILVECRHAGDVPAPVYWDRYDDFVRPELAAPSLGDLLLVWISYIERGVYAANPEGGWAADQPLLDEPPPDVVQRGLW